ncbi:MAG: hypothetical protein ACTSYD_04945 [Candidatus Heimdallarchaeaceae archaeon]
MGLDFLLKKLLYAAKYVQEHERVVCPASWTPSKEVLKPSVELIGKI